MTSRGEARIGGAFDDWRLSEGESAAFGQEWPVTELNGPPKKRTFDQGVRGGYTLSQISNKRLGLDIPPVRFKCQWSRACPASS